MKFIQKILIENEKIIHEIEVDIYQYIVPVFYIFSGVGFLLSFIISPLFISIGIPLILVGLYKYLYLNSIERAVTNFRVIEKTGLFNTIQNEVQFRTMETAEIKQTFLDKILGTGSIEITATGGAKLLMKNVENPFESLKEINSIQIGR